MEPSRAVYEDVSNGASPASFTRREVVRITVTLGVGAAFSAMLGPLTGCSPDVEQVLDEDHKVVTDWLDRAVVVPVEPQRIAATDAFAGEVILSIGAGPLLTSIQDGAKKGTLLRQIYPPLADLPRFMVDGAVNTESLLASGTELAFVKQSVYNSPGQTKNLDKTGIPYIVVDYYTVDEQLEAIGLVGEVCGGEPQARAQALIDYYKNLIKRVEERVSGVAEADRPRVYHAMNVATTTSGHLSVSSDWIGRAGGVNVSTQKDASSKKREYKTSLEEIFSWNPDVIICNDPDTADYFREDSKWTKLRAIREGRVYELPVGVTRWGHWGSFETALAMLWFGVTLHPEQFTDIDLKSEVVSYYRDLLDLEVDDATYQMILEGRGLRSLSAGGEQ